VLVRRAYERLRSDRAALLVTVAAVLWFLVLAVDVWRRHDRFDTFDNDLGFHSQFVWLLSRGHWFSSILGLSPFGHNATFGYVLFVPFAWLGLPIPHVLDIAQAAAIALGVVPLYRLARRRFEQEWVVAAVPIVYLLHPVVQGNVWETFHPEAMAMAPLLAAYDAADEGRWRRYWLFVGLAIIWKTDVALFIAVLGLVVIRRWDRRIGWRTFALGAAWFVVVVGVMIPSLSGGGTVFGPLYGDLGDTPQQVVQNSVSHPSRFVRHVVDARPHHYAVDLLTPYGFAPVLAPATLLVGLPQNMVSLLSEAEFTRDTTDNPHYQALPVVALTLALVEALSWLQRRRPSFVEPAVAIVLACSLGTSVAWGSLPIGTTYSHFWSEDGDPLRAAKEHAVALPDADDVVSAQYRLVPHLTERRLVYSFPNPWQQVFYGVEGTPRPDPATVEWIIWDRTVPFSESEQVLVDCIVAAGTFDEVFSEGEIVVLQRNGADPVDADCV
jgi:uncharacterized membrane protein